MLTVDGLLFTVYFLQFSVYSLLFTVYNLLFTVYPPPLHTMLLWMGGRGPKKAFFVSVLLSVHAKIFIVSCMRDFQHLLWSCSSIPFSANVSNFHTPLPPSVANAICEQSLRQAHCFLFNEKRLSPCWKIKHYEELLLLRWQQSPVDYQPKSAPVMTLFSSYFQHAS